MNIKDFDYNLPPELIAQVPPEERDGSRLMVLNRQEKKVEQGKFPDVLKFLSAGDVLVLNATKVIPARLQGMKEPTGGKVEVFLLKDSGNDTWETLVKPGRRMKIGARIKFGEGELFGEVVHINKDGRRTVKFEYEGNFIDILERIGDTPLPPYIKRLTSKEDKQRYQTVYAREEGAVAAPTAGLHFTETILDQIRAKGIKVVFLTLHLGLASFRLLKEDEEINLTSEYYSLPEETCRVINNAEGKVVAVGTSSVRTLESAVDSNGKIVPGDGWTNLFIQPGYRFQIVEALITNFHLPRSTNLLMVAAFAGKDFLLDAYRQAVESKYRFFSFGDSMLIV